MHVHSGIVGGSAVVVIVAALSGGAPRARDRRRSWHRAVGLIGGRLRLPVAPPAFALTRQQRPDFALESDLRSMKALIVGTPDPIPGGKYGPAFSLLKSTSVESAAEEGDGAAEDVAHGEGAAAAQKKGNSGTDEKSGTNGNSGTNVDSKGQLNSENAAASRPSVSGPDGALAAFPYPVSPIDNTVRLYKPSESSRILQACGAASYMWFLTHWYICTFGVPYLVYWVGKTGYACGKWLIIAVGGEGTVPAPPPILQFLAAILKLMRDALLAPAVFWQQISLRAKLLMSGDFAVADLPKSAWFFAQAVQGAVRQVLERMAETVHVLPAIDVLVLIYLAGCAYVCYDEFYRIPREGRRLLPQFVRTSHDHLRLLSRAGAEVYDACKHWYFPHTAVIFENYAKFVAAGRSEAPTILCYAPHGAFSNLLGLLCSLPETEGYRVMAAPLMKALGPAFSLLRFGYGTLSSADKTTYRQCAQRKEGMILVPGGIPEATLTTYGQERVYLARRKGFIRIALEHGQSLTPVYGFGENLMYKNYGADWFPRLKAWANARGLISVLPFGFLGTPIPKRVIALVVVGEPIPLPKLKAPSSDDVDRYHQLYVEAVAKLYAKYADTYYSLCKARGMKIDTKAVHPSTTPKNILIPATENAPALQLF